MAELRSHKGDRRLEITRGNALRENHLYMTTRPSSPNLHQHVSNSSVKSSWSFNDSEMKRRKRVASYKAYAVEGKVRASIRKGVRWIKNRCSEIVHGY